MAVIIDTLTLSTPVPTSASNPVALELTGAQALAQLPQVVTRLADGSIRLTAPTRGASSKSTRRTRCEWKEPVYWTLASADLHRSQQHLRLTQVNAAQKVVVAQLHVKDDDSPVIKVFWNKGKLTLGFREDYNQATPVGSTLLSNVPLNAAFAVTLTVTAAGLATVTASCNGQKGSSGDLQMDNSWNPHRFNFHGGVYNQVDYSDATPPDDGSVCIISLLRLSHA